MLTVGTHARSRSLARSSCTSRAPQYAIAKRHRLDAGCIAREGEIDVAGLIGREQPIIAHNAAAMAISVISSLRRPGRNRAAALSVRASSVPETKPLFEGALRPVTVWKTDNKQRLKPSGPTETGQPHLAERTAYLIERSHSGMEARHLVECVGVHGQGAGR